MWTVSYYVAFLFCTRFKLGCVICTRLFFQPPFFPLKQSWELRWLDWIFLGGCLPSLSINYVGMSKDMEKKLPQLYYIKMKISYNLGFIAIGVTMAT